MWVFCFALLFFFALTEHKCSSWVWGYRSFYKTADTFSKKKKQLVPYVKRFVIVQTPDAEAAFGRTPALLTEVHRVPRQDAAEASKHLSPASLTVMDQPKK